MKLIKKLNRILAGEIVPQLTRSELEIVREALNEERHCVYCGCCDSRACAGGCGWALKFPQTDAGVCSNCILQMPMEGIVLDDIAIKRLTPKKFWLAIRSGEGLATTAKKVETMLTEFFQKEF